MNRVNYKPRQETRELHATLLTRIENQMLGTIFGFSQPPEVKMVLREKEFATSKGFRTSITPDLIVLAGVSGIYYTGVIEAKYLQNPRGFIHMRTVENAREQLVSYVSFIGRYQKDFLNGLSSEGIDPTLFLRSTQFFVGVVSAKNQVNYWFLDPQTHEFRGRVH